MYNQIVKSSIKLLLISILIIWMLLILMPLILVWEKDN